MCMGVCVCVCVCMCVYSSNVNKYLINDCNYLL